MKTQMRIFILAMLLLLFAIACQNSFLGDTETQSTTESVSEKVTWYFLECMGANTDHKRLQGDSDGEPNTVPQSYSGNWVQWKKVDAGSGWFYLENKETSTIYRRLQGDNDGEPNMVDYTWSGDWVKWKTVDAGDGWVYLENNESDTNHKRLQGDNEDGTATEVSPNTVPETYAGDWVKWKFVNAGTSPTPNPGTGNITRFGTQFNNIGWAPSWEETFKSGLNWSTVSDPWRTGSV